jgi:hypothetical protein
VPGDEFIEDCGKLMKPAEVGLGQPLDYAVTVPGQANSDHAGVVAVRYPLNQPGRLGAVDELHRAVRPQQQVSGQVAHGRRLVPPVPLHRYQQLVLYVGQAGRFSLVLAPPHELAQSDPELKQPLEVAPGHPSHRHLQGPPRLPRPACDFTRRACGCWKHFPILYRRARAAGHAARAAR